MQIRSWLFDVSLIQIWGFKICELILLFLALDLKCFGALGFIMFLLYDIVLKRRLLENYLNKQSLFKSQLGAGSSLFYYSLAFRKILTPTSLLNFYLNNYLPYTYLTKFFFFFLFFFPGLVTININNMFLYIYIYWKDQFLFSSSLLDGESELVLDSMNLFLNY